MEYDTFGNIYRIFEADCCQIWFDDVGWIEVA